MNGNFQTVRRYYNPSGYTPPVLQVNPATVFIDPKISISNSIVTCSFSRQMTISNAANYFDISNTPYNLLVASGTNDASSK
jgi:hypothetical protein